MDDRGCVICNVEALFQRLICTSLTIHNTINRGKKMTKKFGSVTSVTTVMFVFVFLTIFFTLEANLPGIKVTGKLFFPGVRTGN
jgi:hypothetical protein